MTSRIVQTALGGLFPLVITARSVYRRIVRPVTIGVRALVIEDDQILLVRSHGETCWNMPGGGVKRGESLRAAAEREAREETGCVVVAERLLGIYLSLHEGMTNHVAVFVCRATNPPTDQFNLEIAEARYWPLDALPNVAATLPRRLAQYHASAQSIDEKW